MGVVSEKLNGAGMRDRVKVIVGSAPVTQGFADEVGADAFGYDASDAVRKTKTLLKKQPRLCRILDGVGGHVETECRRCIDSMQIWEMTAMGR